MSCLRIDIGSGGGDRPAKGYDMHTDLYFPDDAPVPFIKCSAEKMPFEDKYFGYARCHHVIEHVNDPNKACAEIIRIADSGRFSFPTPQAELMFGREDHKWFVFVDRSRLLFVAKRNMSYGVPHKKTGCALNVDFDWKGGFEWAVVL